MNLKDFDSFRLSDAVTFHDELNPKLFRGNKLIPNVRDQLNVIAQDFLDELGVNKLDVRDITISGSNAAYSYTKHSDLDLHILVNMKDLPQSDVYKELFNAKKSLYNDSHDIKIHGIPVELYVQDSNEPVKSLGEYSIIDDKWLRIPTKRRANFDQTATKSKYEKLLELVKTALKTKNIDKLNKTLKKIKQYRQAGLDKGGEFGPENLAYKALRSQGYLTKLYDLRDKLHSEKLSIESMYSVPKEENLKEKFSKEFEDYHPNENPPGPEFKPTMPKGTVKVDVSDVYDWYKLGQHISNMKGLGKHDFGKGPPSTILSFGDEDTEHKYIQDLLKTGLTTTDIDPPAHDVMKGQKTDPTYNVESNKTTKKIKEVINNELWDNPAPNELKQTRASIGGLEYFATPMRGGPTGAEGKTLRVVAIDPEYPGSPKVIAYTYFLVTSKPGVGEWLESDYTFVDPKYRNKGIAYTMYALAKSLGNDISPSSSQTPLGKKMWKKWGSDAKNLMKENTDNTITLNQLYNGDFPDRNDQFWDYVRSSEFDVPLTVNTLPKHKVKLMLLSQYRIEHLSELNDIIDRDQKRLIKKYMNDPSLSNQIILVADDRIIDGNHRALAAAFKGLPIRYVNLDDLANQDLQEAKVPSVRDQIIADVQKHGGNPDDYFVRFTDTDKLGFSARQWFGQTPDVDHPDFDVDYIGHGKGRRVLWFYPLKTYLDQSKNVYASEQPYAFLVKLKPNAWLQTVKRGDNKIEQPPPGKERVGIYRMSMPPAVLFFKHGYDIIGRYYNFAGRHRRHGEVKGPPPPSVFDKIRGIDESKSFDKCFDKACELYDKAISKNMNPILYQVADYKGSAKNADSKWLKLPKHVWSHYVVVIGNKVYDPTAKQFGPEKETKYSIEKLKTEWGKIYKIRPKELEESASGYIPSNTEKNDPRFKTALTVDIKPDTMKKDAKKFGNKISRTGIPPTLRADGKF